VRTLCASVLAFEALVVALAIVPAVTLTDANGTVIVVGGLLVVACCLLEAALLRTAVGYVLGSVVQVLVVAGGFVLPAMFVLGGLFALLWVTAIVIARRADRVVAAKAAAAREATRRAAGRGGDLAAQPSAEAEEEPGAEPEPDAEPGAGSAG
jgi:hypothetical protein